MFCDVSSSETSGLEELWRLQGRKKQLEELVVNILLKNFNRRQPGLLTESNQTLLVMAA